jgi:hypothetical protein
MELVIRVSNVLMSWLILPTSTPQSYNNYDHPGVASNNQVITFGCDKCFGLVDTRQRDMAREYYSWQRL